jgi:hypothetical protein
VLVPLNFDGLFLTLLCTIRPLSEESLAPLSRGANAFGGLHGFAAIRKAPCGAFPDVSPGLFLLFAVFEDAGPQTRFLTEQPTIIRLETTC